MTIKRDLWSAFATYVVAVVVQIVMCRAHCAQSCESKSPMEGGLCVHSNSLSLVVGVCVWEFDLDFDHHRSNAIITTTTNRQHTASLAVCCTFSLYAQSSLSFQSSSPYFLPCVRVLTLPTLDLWSHSVVVVMVVVSRRSLTSTFFSMY